ncbi:hypothetical protein EVAR_96720_1 [Eumeta japonica]|uniref:Uncharacterized protein n=1 Tax=Eumeta variegata TaxID=151549 RepID=A0A4C1WHE0_EUMVA|nr:hypothetical protein EVAR_96720_1 [Eumeta japonica]
MRYYYRRHRIFKRLKDRRRVMKRGPNRRAPGACVGARGVENSETRFEDLLRTPEGIKLKLTSMYLFCGSSRLQKDEAYKPTLTRVKQFYMSCVRTQSARTSQLNGSGPSTKCEVCFGRMREFEARRRPLRERGPAPPPRSPLTIPHHTRATRQTARPPQPPPAHIRPPSARSTSHKAAALAALTLQSARLQRKFLKIDKHDKAAKIFIAHSRKTRGADLRPTLSRKLRARYTRCGRATSAPGASPGSRGSGGTPPASRARGSFSLGELDVECGIETGVDIEVAQPKDDSTSPGVDSRREVRLGVLSCSIEQV